MSFVAIEGENTMKNVMKMEARLAKLESNNADGHNNRLIQKVKRKLRRLWASAIIF